MTYLYRNGMNYDLKPSKCENIVVGLACLVFDEYNYGKTTWGGFTLWGMHRINPNYIENFAKWCSDYKQRTKASSHLLTVCSLCQSGPKENGVEQSSRATKTCG